MLDHETQVSLLCTVSQDVLYLLPSSAGERLLRIAEGDPGTELSWAPFFRRVLDWDEHEAQEWLSRPGDIEDKLVYFEVFLWKQRHGVFETGSRPKAGLGERARPLTYRLHRYMVDRGFEGIVDGCDPYTNTGVNYRSEIEPLLRDWRLSSFGMEENDFGDLVLLLSVLGPGIHNHIGSLEVQDLVLYILDNVGKDPRLDSFQYYSNDLCNLMLLLSDLSIDPNRTFSIVRDLLISYRKIGINYYPSLMAGLNVYGDVFRDLFGHIELQGGWEIFDQLTSV